MSLVFITFVFGYCVIEYVFTYGISDIWKVFYMSLFNFIQGKSWAAMWYMYLLIGLYIITPLLRPFVKNASKREMRFVIYCLAICAYIIPTINNIFSIEITTFYLGGFKYLLLYLSGYAIANGYFEEKNIYILGIIGFISYITLSSFHILIGDNDGIFIVLFSAAVYSFFANGHYKLKNNRIIELISVDSFGIYLIHTFWLNLFNKGFHIYPDILPLFFGEMAMLIVTVILSIISVEILKRLPVFKKFL